MSLGGTVEKAFPPESWKIGCRSSRQLGGRPVASPWNNSHRHRSPRTLPYHLPDFWRVNVCVERMAPHVVLWAATDEQVRPQCTTGNVVTFAQGPDAIVQLSRADPVDLCKTVCVHFSGPDATVVVRDTGLQVDPDRLRAGMWWFATNN